MSRREVLVLASFALGLAGCVFNPDLGDGQVRCGSHNACPPGQSCGDDALCHVGAKSPDGDCVPLHCFVGWCGPVADGCGHSVDCGPCNVDVGHDLGTPDLAGCAPSVQCLAGDSCGSVDNGCGGALSCGDCTVAGSCSNQRPNHCACKPKTCADVGATCGRYPDGCGTVLNCFPPGTTSCLMANRTVCGGVQPYTCGPATRVCNALKVCPAGACGDIPDGCRNVLHCGDCPVGQICGGGGKASICG
jgi:hypothetical protein